MDLDEFGWIWMDLDGFGWIWMDFDGFGWIWMDWMDELSSSEQHLARLVRAVSLWFWMNWMDLDVFG